MHTANRMALGADTGTAWVDAIDIITRAPGRTLLHQRVRITHPGTEDSRIRSIVEDLLHDLNSDSVDTVVNTLFPAAMAARADGPRQLAERYRNVYPTIRAMSPLNNRGTYFGRLVDYPARDKPVDQLNRLIDQLARDKRRGQENKRHRPRAIYEATTEIPGPVDALDPPDAPDGHVVHCDVLQVYAPIPDTIPQSFPCLSHLSFQRVGNRLHLLAQYRSQYLIRRGYGNYLALGLLQRYIATHTELDVGELTVDIGLAKVDGSVSVVDRHLQRLNHHMLL